MSKISIILIAKNEEKNIADVLVSANWADEIIVVDSKSTDNTVKIASRYTDKVYLRDFDDFSSQKNFAISKCKNDWIFSIDCDERISTELRDSITTAIKLYREYAAFKVKRINKLFGKVLRYAADNDFPIRLFNKNRAGFIQPIHEFLKVEGKIGMLDGELLHNTTPDIESELRKTEEYTELEAKWLLERSIAGLLFKLVFYPIFTFLNIYIIKKGLLDGYEGLVYAFYSARYCFVKYLKAYRLSRDQDYLEVIIAKRFNAISEQFPDKIDAEDSRLNALLGNLSELDNKKVLEIGCGKGRFSNAVSEKGAFCVGIDASINLLKEAPKKNKGIFFVLNATELAFRSDLFDAVFAVEVIEHIPDLDKCVQEMTRVLKPDGILVIIDRNILSINNRRLFVPNLIIKKYHELKNDWMYPRGFPYTEKWFFNNEVVKVLNSYFDKTKSSYVISDSEKRSKTAFLFKKVPLSRHFILWKATGAKNA